MFIKALLAMVAVLFTTVSVGHEQLAANGERQFKVLAVNDIYNIEGIDAGHSGGMARLRSLRRQLSENGESVLLLHAGDFLFPSSMSSQYKGAQMVDLMNGLDGDFNAFDERFFVVFGNHEFDKGRMKYAPMLADRIEQSGFYWLGTNIKFDKAMSKPSRAFEKALINNKLIEINGIKVGIYGITTDISVPEYASIDADYVAVSKRNIRALKAKGAEVILAVTHLSVPQDLALIKALGDEAPDAVFGGHEHARQYACVAQRCVYKADADIRSATVATVTLAKSGEVGVEHFYSIINESTIKADAEVAGRTTDWVNRYQKEYCKSHQQKDGCLLQVLGKTKVDLIAEELEIRRFETNLGSFIADQMLSAFEQVKIPGDRKVQVGLINAGSLRLNQNIPAGTELNEWYLNGIFQYPVGLRLVEITGKQLKQAVSHSVNGWTGNGKFLQVSGVAFRQNTQDESFTDLSLVDSTGKVTPVGDDDKILAAISNYITNPKAGDQDGYTMFNLESEVKYGEIIELKDVVKQVIENQWQQGNAISPTLQGRICNSQRPQLKCMLD